MAEKRSALVVATSEYADARLAPLAGPGRDAEALEKVLGDAEIGGFEVQLALNAPLAELRTTLDSFFADAGRDDLLLVHFSGHGLKDDDGQLYLAAADTRIDRLMSTAIEAGWVSKLMSKSRSDKIALFLDCCFGGAFTTGLTHRAGLDTAGSKETFGGTGRFVITASDAMQYSFEGGERVEGAEPEPSPFTRALVEGLTTGEADRNDDGFVSINELFDYLEDRVHQLSPAQTPTKSAFNQVGDWVIAQSMKAPTIRILPASLQEQLKSDAPLERMGAAFLLRDLIMGGDARTSEAAQKALERLTGDDSKLVAAAAERLFGEMPAEHRPAGTVTTTPLSESALPPELKDALLNAGNSPTESPLVPDSLKMPPPAPVEPAATQPRAAVDVPAGDATTSAAVPPAVSTPPPAASAAQPVSSAAPPATSVSRPVASTPQPAAAAGPAATASPAAAPQKPWTPPPSPGTTSGALWGQPTGAPATPSAVAGGLATPLSQTAPVAGAGRPNGTTKDRQWSIGRAFARAAIGVAFGFALGIFYEIGMDPSNASTDMTGTVLFGILVIALVFGGIVAAIEQFVPALRIPRGTAYAPVGHDRWILAGLLGIIPGLLLVGLGGELVFVVLMVIGFLAAEALVGRGASPAAR
jgi:Caspase domain